jgi:hypothetical protein
MPAGAVYEALRYQYIATWAMGGLSLRHKLLDATIPLHSYCSLGLKPTVPIPFNLREKIVMMYSDGKSETGKMAKMDNGWYTAQIRAFGTYWLAVDSVSPKLTCNLTNGSRLGRVKTLSITATEETTNLQNFRGELDGKWILFEPTGSLYTYTIDEHCPPGKHKLVVKAADENQNAAELVVRFER